MVRPYFHPDRALKVRSKQKRLTTVTFWAAITSQYRLSVGHRRLFSGEILLKLIPRTPATKPATSIKQLARLA